MLIACLFVFESEKRSLLDIHTVDSCCKIPTKNNYFTLHEFIKGVNPKYCPDPPAQHGYCLAGTDKDPLSSWITQQLGSV
jgi:hypothetical protein